MFSRVPQWVGLRALPNSVQFYGGPYRRLSAFPADTQEVLPDLAAARAGRFLNATLMFRRERARRFVYRLCEVSHSDFVSTGPVR